MDTTRPEIRFGDLSLVEFFDCHWRRKPLHVPGGARALVVQTFDTPKFEKLQKTLSAQNSDGMRSNEDGVVFIEAIDRADPTLRHTAAKCADLFGLPAAWFDSVRTYHASEGIGSHFDHSDNFVLQQEGTKTWRLSPPEHLLRADRARRMLGDPQVGGAEIHSASAVEIVLNPGDLLYVPLFWVHEGISDGPSLSLSLVCPAIAFRSAFMQGLEWELKRQGLGWEPAPAFPALASETPSHRQIELLARASKHLLTRACENLDWEAMASIQARALRRPKGQGVNDT